MAKEPKLVWQGEAPSASAPVWLAEAGMLLLCDPDSGRIISIDPVSGAASAIAVGGHPGLVVPTHDGRLLYAADRELRLIEPDGSTTIEAHVDTLGRNAAAGGTVDALGRLWFGVSDSHGEKPCGGLYRYHDERVVPMLFDQVRGSAPAVSADCRRLYALDTAGGMIDRHAVNRAGALSGRTAFLRFAEGEGTPQAIALDSTECLWVLLGRSGRGSGRLRRYAPTGELLLELALPVTDPTGMVFGGAELATIYLTVPGAMWALEAPVAGHAITPFRLARGSDLGLVDDDDH